MMICQKETALKDSSRLEKQCGNIHIWYILLLLRERSWTFYIPALQFYTIRYEKTSLFIMTTDSEGGVNAGKVRYSAGSQT